MNQFYNYIYLVLLKTNIMGQSKPKAKPSAAPKAAPKKAPQAPAKKK